MTAYDDLTDSSPESPDSPGSDGADFSGSSAEALAQQPGGAGQTASQMGGDALDPVGDPGDDSDLGGDLGVAEDETAAGPGVDSSDQERGNLDGSTPSEASREEALDDAGDAVRDPSAAGADNVDGSDLASYTDAGDSGQDNGLNE